MPRHGMHLRMHCEFLLSTCDDAFQLFDRSAGKRITKLSEKKKRKKLRSVTCMDHAACMQSVP